MAEPSKYLGRPENQPHLKVMEVLRRWDPIGVISDENQDEYDGYSPNIVHMLDCGTTVDQLVNHLREIATEMMGIAFDEAHSRDCAQELVSYWPTRPRRRE